MKIAAADVAFSTHHAAVQRLQRRESLVEGVAADGVWDPENLRESTTAVRRGPQAVEQGLLQQRLSAQGPTAPTGQTSPTARPNQGGITPRDLADFELLVQGPGASLQRLLPPAATSDAQPLDLAAHPIEQTKIQLLIATFERLTDKPFALFAPEALLRPAADPPSAEALGQQPASAEAAATAPPAWGLRYQYRESRYEAETTSFSATGIARTEDGREIAIDVDLTMSREFASETHLEVNLGAALQDPLVVNFAGRAAELTQTKFAFDLDSDGADEHISFVGPGSGFIALDRNNNGRVDDGGELFGPASGNGFGELAAHDEDGNLWIDANDPVYERLRVWSKDAAGRDQLVALGQRGVGAIYLGHAATPFSIKDEQNQLQGAVRSTSIYLREDGGAGSVQQVDLVV